MRLAVVLWQVGKNKLGWVVAGKAPVRVRAIAVVLNLTPESVSSSSGEAGVVQTSWAYWTARKMARMAAAAGSFRKVADSALCTGNVSTGPQTGDRSSGKRTYLPGLDYIDFAGRQRSHSGSTAEKMASTCSRRLDDKKT